MSTTPFSRGTETRTRWAGRGTPSKRTPPCPARATRPSSSEFHDHDETGVGGAPQIMLLGPRSREVVGTRDAQNRRFLLGHRVLSGAQGVEFYDEELSELK